MRGGCRGGARGGQQPEGRPRARAAPEPADSRSPHGSASHPPQRPDCRVGLCLPWKVQGRACLPGSTRLPPNASGTVPAEQPSRSRLQSQSPAARGTCSQAPCGPGHRAPAPPLRRGQVRRATRSPRTTVHVAGRLTGRERKRRRVEYNFARSLWRAEPPAGTPAHSWGSGRQGQSPGGRPRAAEGPKPALPRRGCPKGARVTGLRAPRPPPGL